MLDYDKDRTIKFQHTPVINKIAFKVNHVGTDAGTLIGVKDYTDTDDNTIYVSDTVGLDTQAGTKAAPKKTIAAGITATTSDKTKVIILDSAFYAEDISGCTYTYFQGMYAETAQTPKHSHRILDFTPADANSIFLDKTGNDTTGTGTQANPVLTIAKAITLCDGTHQNVVIQDSGTYEEGNLEFTGNFQGLYASLGYTPKIETDASDPNIADYSEKENIITVTFDNAVGSDKTIVRTLTNGNILIVYIYDTTNQMYYAIYSSDGVEVTPPTNFGGQVTYSYEIDVDVLTGGNWVCVYRLTADNDLYFQIKSQLGAEVKAETRIKAGETEANYVAVSKLNNGNFVTVFGYTQSGPITKSAFIIYDSTGNLVKAETEMSAVDNYTKISVDVLTGGNWVAAYSNTGASVGDFEIWSEAGVLVKAQTSFDSANQIGSKRVKALANGNWVIAWSDYLNTLGEFAIYDSTGTVVKAATTFYGARIYWVDITTYENTDFMIAYSGSTAGNYGIKYKVFNEDGTGVIGETAIVSQTASEHFFSLTMLQNGNYCLGYLNTASNNDGMFKIQYPYSCYVFKASTDAKINGVEFNGEDQNLLYALRGDAANIEIKWAELYNYRNDANIKYYYMIFSDKEVNLYNSQFYDGLAGVFTTEDKSLLHDNLFYRVDSGYAIDIDGAAASSGDITIEHCDFFDCYGGIRLQNNNGTNEIIKNCIFHDCNINDIFADTTITLSYAVYTDNMTGVIIGTSVVKANPLYVNEGYADPDDTDLNIKVILLGFPANSPAKDLADDSRNAGSWDVQYIGTATSWTTITVTKPFKITPVRQYAGAVNTQRRDGSYSSYKDAQSEIIPMEWTGIINAEVELLFTMWMSDESDVRVYPQPLTTPDAYSLYTMLRKDINDSVSYWPLSRTGKQKVKITFARAIT